ncbi:MAG: Ig-like domain-containing protein [Paraclostridium sp.]
MADNWMRLLKSKNGLNGQLLVKIAQSLDDKNIAIPTTYTKDNEFTKALKSREGIDGEFLAMVAQVMPLQTALDPNEQDLTKIVAAINASMNTIDTHSTKHDQHTTSISDLTKEQNSHKSSIAQLQSQINDAAKSLTYDDKSGKLDLKDGTGSVLSTVYIQSGGGGTPTVPVTGVTLSVTDHFIQVGETKQLGYIISPDNATNKDVRWSTNNAGVAAVASNGTIHGLGVGTATITVTTIDGGKTSSCTVNVAPAVIAVNSVTVDFASRTLHPGEFFQATATVLPVNATNRAVTWETTDNTTVSIDEMGLMEAHKEGSVNITVRSVQDPTKFATVPVNVVDINTTPDWIPVTPDMMWTNGSRVITKDANGIISATPAPAAWDSAFGIDNVVSATRFRAKRWAYWLIIGGSKLEQKYTIMGIGRSGSTSATRNGLTGQLVDWDNKTQTMNVRYTSADVKVQVPAMTSKILQKDDYIMIEAVPPTSARVSLKQTGDTEYKEWFTINLANYPLCQNMALGSLSGTVVGISGAETSSGGVISTHLHQDLEYIDTIVTP